MRYKHELEIVNEILSSDSNLIEEVSIKWRHSHTSPLYEFRLGMVEEANNEAKILYKEFERAGLIKEHGEYCSCNACKQFHMRKDTWAS